MVADLGTIVILALVIFGAIEFAIVIIPAMISRSKITISPPSEFDIPIILSHPFPQGNIRQMRSWYFDKDNSHWYKRNINPDPAVVFDSGYPGQDPPVFTGTRHHFPMAGNDMDAVNKANRAILRANKAVLHANHAILEANAAIQEAGEDDLEWIDEISEMSQFRFPPKR